MLRLPGSGRNARFAAGVLFVMGLILAGLGTVAFVLLGQLARELQVELAISTTRLVQYPWLAIVAALPTLIIAGLGMGTRLPRALLFLAWLGLLLPVGLILVGFLSVLAPLYSGEIMG